LSLFQSIAWYAGSRTLEQAQRRPDLRLRTERLVLREFTAADTERTLPDLGSEDYWRYELFRRLGSYHLHALVQNADLERVRQPRRTYSLAAEARAHGALVGTIRLSVKGFRRNTGELGWMIYPQFSGQGFATEMAAAMVRLGLGDLALARVSAQCHVDNGACLRIFQKLGMRPEKSVQRYAYARGTLIPGSQWTITA
jgi:RimJ/RimL family protein N-acetyltransferase